MNNNDNSNNDNSIIVCSSCKSGNASDNKFCYKCGRLLTNEDQRVVMDDRFKNNMNSDQNDINFSYFSKQRKNKFGLLVFFGMFVVLMILVSFFSFVGVGIFILLVYLTFSYKGDNNSFLSFFRFVGTGALSCLVFFALLFGTCIAIFSSFG